MARLKLGVLISGRGSNLEALVRAFEAPQARVGITVVASNVEFAAGLELARRHGIATASIDHRAYSDRASFDARLDEVLSSAGVDLVCLAGFMRLLGDDFVSAWRDRLLNIHPSLLPAFKGRHPQLQALEAGVRVSGCTVHYVRPAMDAGPIIAQAAVPVLVGDDEASLSRRILAAEHRLYPAVVELIADGQIKIIGERVELTPEAQKKLNACNGLQC